jgi:DNA topoisomerase 2-associated protein PAT1
MELGGLDDDGVIAPVLGHADDDEYHLFDKGEVTCFLC